MLSRVAERIYWTARYLERVENTARLIRVFNNVLLDLPQGVDLSWYTLIIINSSEEAFNERYKVQSERNVLKFMLSNRDNPSSLVNTLFMIRENIRTSRDAVPPETWELVNELHLYLKTQLQYGLNKHARHEFLAHIISASQQIMGLISGSMPRSAGWYFLMVGVHLERAEMTTRLLDTGAAVLLSKDKSPNQDQIVWGNVLTSASAEMAYLNATGSRVSGAQVVEFLLTHSEFPRSINFCLNRLRICIQQLPRNEPLAKQLKGHIHNSLSYCDYNQLGQPFREHLNDMQIGLSRLHNSIACHWFS